MLGYGDMSYRGCSSSSMGDNLPFVELGSGLEVKQASPGVSLKACSYMPPMLMSHPGALCGAADDDDSMVFS